MHTRKLTAHQERTLASLAREYGVTPSLISQVTTGSLYLDAGGPITQRVRRVRRTKPRTTPTIPSPPGLTAPGPASSPEPVVGSKVRLVAGGPTMVVLQIGPGRIGTEVVASWFDASRCQTATFPLTAVEVVS